MIIFIIAFLIAISAICNAVMDIISFHYEYSIFKDYNKQYWNPKISWVNKYINNDPLKGRRKWFFNLLKVHEAFTDAWHLMKSTMIVGLCLAATIGLSSSLSFNCFFGILLLIGGGLIWNLTFNLFYNVILRCK